MAFLELRDRSLYLIEAMVDSPWPQAMYTTSLLLSLRRSIVSWEGGNIDVFRSAHPTRRIVGMF